MAKFLLSKYPRNWSETKQILGILDQTWQELLEIPDKRQRIKGWLKITREINALYQQSKEHIETTQAQIKEAKKNFQLTKIISLNFELNFYQKNLKSFESWMKIRKIPKA